MDNFTIASKIDLMRDLVVDFWNLMFFNKDMNKNVVAILLLTAALFTVIWFFWQRNRGQTSPEASPEITSSASPGASGAASASSPTASSATESPEVKVEVTY